MSPDEAQVEIERLRAEVGRWQRIAQTAARLGASEVNQLRAKIARVEALCDQAIMHDHDGFPVTYVSWVRAALADPEEATDA